MTQLSKKAISTIETLTALATEYPALVQTSPRQAFSKLRSLLVHNADPIIKGVLMSDIFEGFISETDRKNNPIGVAKEYVEFKAIYNTTGGHRNNFVTTLKLKHVDPMISFISLEQILEIWKSNGYQRMSYFQFLEAVQNIHKGATILV